MKDAHFHNRSFQSQFGKENIFRENPAFSYDFWFGLLPCDKIMTTSHCVCRQKSLLCMDCKNLLCMDCKKAT